MDGDVVEVVARFGDTILDVAHVGPSGAYRIGSAPRTNLAVPGVTSFPLVDGRIVRCPVGMRAVERADGTELSIGALTIVVARAKLPHAPIARPRADWRSFAFLLGSLLAHLAIWFVAVSFAPLERLAPPRASPFRLARIEAPVPPVAEREPVPQRQSASTAASSSRPRATQRARGPRADRAGGPSDVGASAAAAVARMMKSFDDLRVAERLDELDPDDAYLPERHEGGSGFGNGRSFDPTDREGWGTVETGAYATLPFDVKLCPNESCTVDGPIPALYVRTHLHRHMAAIYACYVRYAEGPGTIVLELTITADGAVRDARGSGLGETGACAARVAGDIFFKALGRETHVRYPLRFNAPP